MPLRRRPRAAAALLALTLLAAPSASADTEAQTPEEATAAADAEVAAARQRVEAMEQLSEEHAQATADATHAFQERMKAAKTPEERRAIQAEFQQGQRAREDELRRKLAELRPR